MKTIEIDGINFTKINSSTKQGKAIIYNACHPWRVYENITDAYNNPSIAKRNIWTYWKRWFNNSNIVSGKMWICSRNSNYFSIAFNGFLGEHEIYGYITYTNNKVVIL